MKLNKRGFLLAEETLKVILAVIAIGFLVFLLFSLYNAGKNSKDLGLARESLDFLEKGMNDSKTSIDIYNPKGWNIGTWPHAVVTSNFFGLFGESAEIQHPESCENAGWTSCICICEENSAKSCDEGLVCIDNTRKLEINNGNIEINNPPITLKIDYANKKISKE